MKKRRRKNRIKRKYILLKALVILVGALSISLFIHIRQIDYTESEKDFLYLSQILKRQTKGIDNIMDRLRIMTEWLSDNVKAGTYPPDFNGNGVANVIRGGIGNCGYQACNISCFADMLGLKEQRIVHNRKEWGAPGLHTFAEINVDGKWIIFDPDRWHYLRNKKGELVGMDDIVNHTSDIENAEAATWIYNTVQKKGFRLAKSWQETPFPYGEDAYPKYESYGMLYIYRGKLAGLWGAIVLGPLLIFFCSLLLLLWWYAPRKRTAKYSRQFK